MTKVKSMFGGKRREVDMTEGNIFRHLIAFAFPLLLGNLFQQFYNMVDAWVVGNYVSNEAFAAVGSVTSIINLLIGFFSGFANGSGVVISQYFGARREDKVQDAVHTFICLTLTLSVVFTVVGVTLTPTLLRFMKIDPAVMPEAITYLTIYFSGISGLLIYNTGAGILRAVGDSRRPFFFLMTSALTNITLDLVFVLVFDMGVAGVAYATIIAQAFSAVLVITTLLRTTSCIRLHLTSLRFHWDVLRKIIHIGFPAALQMSITSFSNIFVMSYINQFGADVTSGWACYTKIDHQVILAPIQSLSMANSTFVSQNLGNRNVERAKEGVRKSVIMTASITIFIATVIFFASPLLVSFFNSKPEVIEYGTWFLKAFSPCFFLVAINNILTSTLRGAGKSRVPMVIMLLSFVLFRQSYMYVVSNFIANDFRLLAMGFPAGWLVACLITFGYYKKVGIEKGTIVEKQSDS